MAQSSSGGAASPKQLPALIELFGVSGTYILRIHDMAMKGAALTLAGKLPSDANSLVVCTPTDTKVFSLAGTVPVGDEPATQGREEDIDIGPDGAVHPRGTLRSTGDPMEDAMRLADQATPLERGPEAETPPEDTDGKKPNTSRARRRPSSNDVSPNSPCGRCAGSGKIGAVGPNGEADSTTCPVCKGTGAIHRYGSSAAAATPGGRRRR